MIYYNPSSSHLFQFLLSPFLVDSAMNVSTQIHHIFMYEKGVEFTKSLNAYITICVSKNLHKQKPVLLETQKLYNVAFRFIWNPFRSQTARHVSNSYKTNSLNLSSSNVPLQTHQSHNRESTICIACNQIVESRKTFFFIV